MASLEPRVGKALRVPDDFDRPLEAAEADLLDQQRTVDEPDPAAPVMSDDPEAPDEDRLEQAQEVPHGDDERVE